MTIQASDLDGKDWTLLSENTSRSMLATFLNDATVQRLVVAECVERMSIEQLKALLRAFRGTDLDASASLIAALAPPLPETDNG